MVDVSQQSATALASAAVASILIMVRVVASIRALPCCATLSVASRIGGVRYRRGFCVIVRAVASLKLMPGLLCDNL